MIYITGAATMHTNNVNCMITILLFFMSSHSKVLHCHYGQVAAWFGSACNKYPITRCCCWCVAARAAAAAVSLVWHWKLILCEPYLVCVGCVVSIYLFFFAGGAFESVYHYEVCFCVSLFCLAKARYIGTQELMEKKKILFFGFVWCWFTWAAWISF